MNADERSFKHVALTRQIVGVFFGVYAELGFGFLESVYKEAMTIALRDKGLDVQREVGLQAQFRGQPVGQFRADLLVEGAVLIELKAGAGIQQAHVAQLLNYLRCSLIEVGLILNFGPRPQIRRLAFENPRKRQLH